VHPMSPANASSPWSSSSASQLLSDGRASPALASRHVQLTQKARCIIKRKPCPSRRPPPIYITTTPVTFARIVQEATDCPVHTSSGVRRQAAIASESSYLPLPPTVSMLSTLDTLTFFPDRTAPAPAQEPEDKSSCGGVSQTISTTSTARVEEEDPWLLQELEAMTGMLDFLFDDFPNLKNWGII
jgi:hypothetical protein